MSRFLLADRRFRPLFLCQLLSAFADNLLRNALGVLALWSAAGRGDGAGWMVAAAACAFVAPAALLSGLGGELADRMDKARLIRRLKLADAAIAAAAAVALATGEAGAVFAALVAAGIVSALFGPVKYGILPDQLAPGRLAAANALVEAATFAAILAATLGASLLAGHRHGAALIAALVAAAAALSWVAALAIPATVPAAPALRVRADLVASTLDLVRGLRADPRSWRAALAAAWFWMVGVAVLSLLPALVHDTLGGGAALGGLVLALFAAGIACGSGVASLLAGGRVVLLTATPGCALCGLSLIAAWLLTRAARPGGVAASWPLCLALFAAAIGAGMLAVPTQAAVQAWAAPERRARAVAGTNVLSALGMAFASALLVLAQTRGAGAPALLGAVGALCLLLAPALLALPVDLRGELAWLLRRTSDSPGRQGQGSAPRPGSGDPPGGASLDRLDLE